MYGRSSTFDESLANAERLLKQAESSAGMAAMQDKAAVLAQIAHGWVAVAHARAQQQ